MNEVVIPEEALESFKVEWTRFTARSQPAFKFLGGHQLYSFLENLQAPLGFIDDTRPPEARKVYYDYVRHELQLKGTEFSMKHSDTTCVGISYRKLLYLLCLHASPPEVMPYGARMRRQDEVLRLKAYNGIVKVAAAWRGQKARADIRNIKDMLQDHASVPAHERQKSAKALISALVEAKHKNAEEARLAAVERGEENGNGVRRPPSLKLDLRSSSPEALRAAPSPVLNPGVWSPEVPHRV